MTFDEAVKEFVEHSNQMLVVIGEPDGSIRYASHVGSRTGAVRCSDIGLELVVSADEAYEFGPLDCEVVRQRQNFVARLKDSDRLYSCRYFETDQGRMIIGERIGNEDPGIVESMAELNAEMANLSRDLKQKNAELRAANDRIVELTRTDPLTGLYNRRYFSERIEESLSLATRHGADVALIMADLDHFKTVNDTFGHDVGDLLLKGFAGLLVHTARREDICARFGGEEFLILCPQTGENEAFHLAERIRAALEMSDFAGNGHRATASFGVAGFRTGDSSESLIRRADCAMYDAKKSGRNRCVLAAQTDC